MCIRDRIQCFAAGYPMFGIVVRNLQALACPDGFTVKTVKLFQFFYGNLMVVGDFVQRISGFYLIGIGQGCSATSHKATAKQECCDYRQGFYSFHCGYLLVFVPVSIAHGKDVYKRQLYSRSLCS